MAVNLGIAKLCLCTGAGLVFGGAAVKIADRPKPRVHHAAAIHKAKATRAIPTVAAVAPLACEPLLIQGPLPTIGEDVVARVRSPSYIAGYLPIGISERIVYVDRPDIGPPPGMPQAVPEPGMLVLFGLGAAALLGVRRRRSYRP